MAFIFMPAGVSLDALVYRELVPEFFRLRLLCSALLLFLWWFVKTPVGSRNYRLLGWTMPALPTAFISWMIYRTDGPDSPYYAGLNLVLLGAAILLRWTFADSVIVFLEVLFFYILACLLHGPIHDMGGFYNNFYFLCVTGVFVVIGSQFYNRLRFREFAARFELDRNKQMLEETNQKLDVQNRELADAIQKLTEAEAQLVQKEKMASLGVMSAGIIHEINNPLNFATTGLYTLKKKAKYVPPEQRGDFEDILKDVEDGVGRVKNIVSDLRMFTHPETEAHEEVEVSDAVNSALRFLSGELKDRVRVVTQLPEGQTVRANKTKLIHVLVNLIQNSLDAMQSKSFNGEQPTIWIEGREEKGGSYLVVRDNGMGIESQHLDKIFDPFFTTKDVGQGMGLGLSICYRILQECQGRISVRTERGKFCEFTLEFPTRA